LKNTGRMQTDSSRIYIESCPFIDMAKHHAQMPLATNKTDQANREKNVWYCTKILEAARDRKVSVYTSIITVAECTHVGDGKSIPSDNVKRFYMGLLASGKSGIELISSTLTIIEQARSLRWNSGIALGGLDSIHLASALFTKCEEFITTDDRLLRNAAKIAELKIKVIQASDTRCLPSEYTQFTLASISPHGKAKGK